MAPDDAPDGPPVLRMALILACCLAVLGLAGFLAWRTSSASTGPPPPPAPPAETPAIP
jgi:hypothetical protein